MNIYNKGRIAINVGTQNPMFDLWYKKDYYNILCGVAIFGLYLCVEFVHCKFNKS